LIEELVDGEGGSSGIHGAAVMMGEVLEILADGGIVLLGTGEIPGF